MSLLQCGIITGYRFTPAEIQGRGRNIAVITPETVHIEGDRVALELATEQLCAREPEPPPGQTRVSDGRADYYRRCEQFLHTTRYRNLPAASRNIWRLHALGRSNMEIVRELRVTEKKVRVTLSAGRVMLGLPKTVTTTSGMVRAANARED